MTPLDGVTSGLKDEKVTYSNAIFVGLIGFGYNWQDCQRKCQLHKNPYVNFIATNGSQKISGFLTAIQN